MVGLFLALESEEPKVADRETEVVVYGKIGSVKGFEEALFTEEQEQYQIKSSQVVSGNNGIVRVRKSTREGQIKFELTTKVKHSNNGVQDSTEITTPITEEQFNAFKSIAGSSMSKTRYYYKAKGIKIKVNNTEKTVDIPEVGYEVDVFKDDKGQVFPWCKVDIELDSILQYVKDLSPDSDFKMKITAAVSRLPVNISDFFTEDTATPEQKVMLSGFYETVFTKKL